MSFSSAGKPRQKSAAGSGVHSHVPADGAALPGIEVHTGPHIGIDEAGRGCLAGPVVAAAVFFNPEFNFADLLPGLDDSKKIGERKRKDLACRVTELALSYGIGLSWQDEIDKVNILNATFRAMARAALALAARMQSGTRGKAAMPRLIIDGNKTIPTQQWDVCAQGVPASAIAWEQHLPLPVSLFPSCVPDLPEQCAVVDGDALVPSISAASVLAKTVRDGLMERLDDFYPGYEFSRHKGYGTKIHLAMLERNGPCRLHRLTFRRVKQERASTGEQFSLL